MRICSTLRWYVSHWDNPLECNQTKSKDDRLPRHETATDSRLTHNFGFKHFFLLLFHKSINILSISFLFYKFLAPCAFYSLFAVFQHREKNKCWNFSNTPEMIFKVPLETLYYQLQLQFFFFFVIPFSAQFHKWVIKKFVCKHFCSIRTSTWETIDEKSSNSSGFTRQTN